MVSSVVIVAALGEEIKFQLGISIILRSSIELLTIKCVSVCETHSVERLEAKCIKFALN